MAEDTKGTGSKAPHERRNFYRIRTVLPLAVRREDDANDIPLAPMNIDISGGGIGVLVNTEYAIGEVLMMTIALSANELIQAKARVVNCQRVEHHNNGFHIGATFIEIGPAHRDALIRYVMRLQAERLEKHYLA